MFHLSIRVKPQSAAFEVTENEVRNAAVKALLAADKRGLIALDLISTETRSILTSGESCEIMQPKVEITIFTSAPDWLALPIDNKMERFLQTMKGELRYLGDGNLSVFVVDSQHFSA